VHRLATLELRSLIGLAPTSENSTKPAN